jgi:hypothetical protein
MNIDQAYQRMLNRRVPPDEQMIKEAYEHVRGTYTRYILGAMAPVGATRTRRLEEQGDRVENQLQNRLSAEYPALQFKRQGSVSNRTHIRYYSDVDVLVLIGKFHTVQSPLQPTYPYAGDVVDDLLVLRRRCREELTKAFSQATVDDSGSTALTLSGASLVCAVDAVPSNWYNTVAYDRGDGDYTRGVMVLNKSTKQRKTNYPFLFNSRLEVHDSCYSGSPRGLIRLLKSIREDHLEENPGTTIEFSSFDICSIVYRVPAQYFVAPVDQPLELIRNCMTWLATVLQNSDQQNALMVIDDTRKIFDTDRKAPGLLTILGALHKTWQAAMAEQQLVSVFRSRAHLAA